MAYMNKAAAAKSRDELIGKLVVVLQKCDEAMHYVSEYDIPLCLHDNIKQALAEAKAQGYGE